MSDFNKSYRIRTEIGKDTSLHVKLDREYDVLELMSLKINQDNAYKFHTSEYGVIAGRVLANDAFGIPNAKISVFINIDNTDINDVVKTVLYPYNRTSSKDKNNIRYNLLPNEQVNNCHTIIGTFPEKQYMLDNDDVLEVFDKYYKYTTRTNNAGDYMIFGVPVGSQTLHTDIDLSDIGILSQKPRDMVYKGYNIEQFENPNKFKHSTNLESLTQVISQDNITEVIPFWGDEDEGTIGITRCDINVQYKFEPTCVFMGSVVSDTASNGISKKCIPTPGMGAMDEITTGSGTIEMIRKTPSGKVEEFQIKGTQLINGDGVWCYQIPMNLDYMMTDEFGNMVPTNDSNKGIPTRTRVRFRISMQDFDSDSINMFRCKMLVPHNPDIYSDNCKAELDYDFGDNTKESSYRDLFWNCVYSVKSYIPRIQRGTNWRNEKFTGFKRVNYYNDKNPIPYNNIRIRIPFMYMILCVIIKAIINVTSLINRTLISLAFSLMPSGNGYFNKNSRPSLLSLSGELCNEDLEHLCFIPGVTFNNKEDFEINGTKPDDNFYTAKKTFLAYTVLKFYQKVTGENKFRDIFSDGEMGENDTDEESIDIENTTDDLYRAEKVQGNNEYQYHIYGIRVTNNMNYLIQCIEMNLAREFKVIQFDFYNDWINGLIYIPRWARKVKRKIRFLGINISKGGKIKACNENFSSNRRNIVQQCGLKYRLDNNSVIDTPIGCDKNKNKNKCHKSKEVRLKYPILKNSGIVTTKETIKQQYVYYFKPYDHNSYDTNGKNVRLFSTDIILLGSMDDCNKWGIPNILKEMVSSTYQMPPNLALTDSELEGTEYETERIDHNLPLSNNKHRIEVGFNEHYRCLYFYLANCYRGMSPFDEIGDYTEISGINWNYNGPLQNVRKNTKPNKLYTPGGHFLGISCTNPETTIKTCVNLSRICEYGTPMSQRETINVPEMSNGVLNIKYLSTVPTGFISNSDINDGEFRRVFSTLNSNRLRTIKDKKTNYLKYDFIHLNPIGFGGELYDRIMYNYDNNDTAKNFNRFITNNVIERNFEFDDDNNFYYREIKNEQINVSETQIMRTNENRDDEYYKFRFGYTENNLKFIDFNNDDIKNRRYLYNNLEGDNNRKCNSFPMYNNSFYFYFGLHDGRTALDEFKKNYYAVCEKYALKYIEDNTDDKENYLTIEALEDNLSVKFSNNCLYSINCVLWNELSANTNTITVNIGEKLYFKANLTPTTQGIGTFNIDKKCNLLGNCNSMLFGDEAVIHLSLKGKNYAFHKLFYNCDKINKVSSKFLPATTLEQSCYQSMFAGCTSLTTAPELPATKLERSCYQYMFSRCSSLEVAPELPAKNMVEKCYSYMFNSCNRLTDAPEILGETIAKNCYEYMFNNCTSMIKGPSKLSGDVLFDNCYQFMFAGCTSLTTAPELPATTLANNCYQSMFYNCTGLTTAPDLPATTLEQSCYQSMFAGCTSLTTAPELPATKLNYWCYDSMFRECTSLTTAPELPATTLELTCYDYMFTGCASLNYIKALFTTTDLYDEVYEEYNYTTDWVKGVAPTGVFVKNINAAWNEIGDNGIPTGWDTVYYGELDYLTIECLEYCYIGFSPHADVEYRTYKTNDEWIPLSSNEKGFSEGKYEFRRRNVYNPNVINRFSITGKCNLLGSVMSVLYIGDEFKGKNDIIEDGYSLKELFYNCKDIVSVSPTFLPATKLTEGCYDSMFRGCASLITAPELPATTLTEGCYAHMFQECTSLTIAPELSAKKLVDSCYSNMFRDCIELNKITMLAEEGDSDLCLDKWVKSQYQMSDNGTFIKSNKLDLEIGDNGIPDGWNVIEID